MLIHTRDCPFSCEICKKKIYPGVRCM